MSGYCNDCGNNPCVCELVAADEAGQRSSLAVRTGSDLLSKYRTVFQALSDIKRIAHEAKQAAIDIGDDSDGSTDLSQDPLFKACLYMDRVISPIGLTNSERIRAVVDELAALRKERKEMRDGAKPSMSPNAKISNPDPK